MNKKTGLNRIVIRISSYNEFDNLKSAKDELDNISDSFSWSLFDNAPEHIFFQNEDDLSAICIYTYHYSERSLTDLDQDILNYTGEMNIDVLSITDFDNKLHQGYSSGEYDSGMFSQPEDKEDYNDYIINYLNNSESDEKFPLILD
jgi:hypothetical protein